jgi:2-(1,2-epoxy-1,2-dihydrophenyl)acetyl-CoA isomerase
VGPIRSQVGGAVARLTLARPEVGNAVGLQTARLLRDAAVAAASCAATRVVLLDAEGPAFCVGGDLREFAGVEDPSARVAAVAEVAQAVHEALLALLGAGVPVVTAVQGVAAGGGLGLALAGDVVLAARGARFRVAYTAAGLSPDCGVSWRLPRAVGAARAADLALTNRLFTAEEAAAWGAVSRLVDDDRLADTAAELCESLAAAPSDAVRTTLGLLRGSAGTSLAEQLPAEAAGIARLAGTADGREGIAAFLAKRPPRWS